MFEPDKHLKEAVEQHDRYRAIVAIIAIIMVNPTDCSEEVRNSVRYSEEHGLTLYEQNDPDYPIEQDRSKWTDDKYYARALSRLEKNFTQERLAHVLEVARATHCSAAPATATTVQPKSNKQTAGGETTSKKAEGHWGAIIAALAGIALVALIIALVASKK